MEALASQLRAQFGPAPKIWSPEGIAPENRKTLIELEKLHPAENETLDLLEDYSCQAFQLDEAKLLLQLQSC